MKKIIGILYPNSIVFMGIAQTRTTIHKIAFGSCEIKMKEPILDLVTRYNPEFFVFLGDNIYGDTREESLEREVW